MESSMVLTFGSQFFPRNANRRMSKFQSFGEWGSHTVIFKFSDARAQPARVLMSKRDVIGFEERTSPIEVNPLLFLMFPLRFAAVYGISLFLVPYYEWYSYCASVNSLVFKRRTTS